VIEREFSDGSRIVSSVLSQGETRLILELDGQRVSWVTIVPMLMRIGAAAVRMDGIAGVGTEEAFRNRGYSRRMMETAVELMRTGDAALSTLYGIADFYPKFGYATTGPDWTVTLPVRKTASAPASLPAGWSVREVCSDDLPVVKRLYFLNTRCAAGALVRHMEADQLQENVSLTRASPAALQIGGRTWTTLGNVTATSDTNECRVVLDGNGDVAAYAWRGQPERWRARPDAFHLAEVMAEGPVAADAVLAACQQWATEAGNDPDEIRMAIPPEGPVANAAAYQGGTFTGLHTRDGDFMGRVLDTGRLLHQLRPELSARIRASRLGFEGDLVIATDAGEATLSIGPEGVTTAAESGGLRVVAELPQETLVRLCLGAFEPEDILARLSRAPERQIAKILTALFPRRAPHIYPMDRF
jgi:predicted N-acetyltransferase YhbS